MIGGRSKTIFLVSFVLLACFQLFFSQTLGKEKANKDVVQYVEKGIVGAEPILIYGLVVSSSPLKIKVLSETYRGEVFTVKGNYPFFVKGLTVKCFLSKEKKAIRCKFLKGR